MTNSSILERARLYLFPPISRRDVLEIATRKLAQPSGQATLICHSRKPARFNIYNAPAEPCWWVQVPWADGLDGHMLRSCRVIVVGRGTGIIHYDGSVHDEG